MRDDDDVEGATGQPPVAGKKEGDSGPHVPLPPGLEEMPKDPWGNEYGYEIVDNKPTAYCLGKDQTEGGEGDDEDLYYPKREEY